MNFVVVSLPVWVIWNTLFRIVLPPKQHSLSNASGLTRKIDWVGNSQDNYVQPIGEHRGSTRKVSFNFLSACPPLALAYNLENYLLFFLSLHFLVKIKTNKRLLRFLGSPRLRSLALRLLAPTALQLGLSEYWPKVSELSRRQIFIKL